MDREGPYRPPGGAGSDTPPPKGGDDVLRRVSTILARTRPWVMFVGAFGLVLCGLIVLLAGVFIAAGGIPGFEALGTNTGAAAAAIYLLLAFIYFFPSLYLLRYGMAIRRIGPRCDPAAVEQALSHQLSFWRFMGVFLAGTAALYAGVFVLGMILALLGPSPVQTIP